MYTPPPAPVDTRQDAPPDQQAGRARSTIELTLFGFLVSLTIKASLDSAYGHVIADATSGWELWAALYTPYSLLLFTFLITLIRFVYGAYRFHEESQRGTAEAEPWLHLWNIFATVMLFVCFYVASLSIKHTNPFAFSLIAVHVWDLCWFSILLRFAKSLSEKVREVLWIFLAVDVLTGLCLAISLNHRNLIIAVMLASSLLDLVLNRNFFFHPERWRGATEVRSKD